ncbi:VWA8 [Symbiodinium sp. CCMP2456]|nr:VWA8 [Symbiodinium sp. CCMP2456]
MMRCERRVVSIGDVSMSASDNLTPLVPTVPPRRGGLHREGGELPSSELTTLRWMMQKALLRQDMFLLGPPGPLLRHTVFRFCELLRREVEYVGVTRDTGEADLKQRCEICSGSVKYVDQAPVRAAIHGRVLVLEGIEKAERNVLPLLNNLLENREMSLEDRRFLLAPERAKQLRAQFGSHKEFSQLVPVHEDFLVVALGMPERGNPLDPPLRSRFAALQLSSSLPSELVGSLAQLAPSLPTSSVERLLAAAATLQDLAEGDLDSLKIPGLDIASLGCAVRVLEAFPGTDMQSVFKRVYPATAIVPLQEQEMALIKKVLAELHSSSVSYSLEDVSLAHGEVSEKLPAARLRFRKCVSGRHTDNVVEALAACGPFLRASEDKSESVNLEKDIASEEGEEAHQLRSLSAKELRTWLSARGVSHTGCFEKAEFLARAQDHLKQVQGNDHAPRPVGILSRSLFSQLLSTLAKLAVTTSPTGLRNPVGDAIMAFHMRPSS